MAQGRLLTLDRVNNWADGYDEGVCILCGSGVESHGHLFFTCNYSYELLALLCNWLHL